MFGLFDSAEKKARTNAANWLELAGRVYDYRRDVLAPALLAELTARTQELRALLLEKADAGRLKLGIEALEHVLRRAGGTHYPKSSWTENIEFFLVAAIVILGVRTYFVQPFKIPTNSMWPSYYGMTPEVFPTKADEPSPQNEVLRFLTLGARTRRVDAPVSGEVLLPVENSRDGRGMVKSTVVPGRSWLVFPTQLREYRVLVGGQFVSVTVPFDFDFDWVARDTFFPTSTQGATETLRSEYLKGNFKELVVDDGHGGRERLQFITTGKTVQVGDRLLSFDILTGDQLFVDRISYHFVRPKVGDGFVFRTGNIAGITGPETYYIKRLVGTPGDTLEVHEPILYRNGTPITGAPAFDKNANREGLYRGYFNGHAENHAKYLLPGDGLTVPPQSYFAMGDNSGNSSDGRYWGFVPAKDVIGRPLFIYYPLTHRWGVAP